ncbi:hypothetical protein [Kitasatospora sp. NPDC002040]|uniref:lipase/acyltransferase domain-containing protein n=1 Tax=Kitasatospora sp. NPDC002040 TaxID=3154661 RepID=UPI0033332007
MGPRLRHLIVVLPGIGGSVLRTPGGAARWDGHRRQLAAAALHPARLGLDEHPELTPVGLLPDIRLAGPFVLPGYDRLVRRIERTFHQVRVDTAGTGRPDPRADLLLFPYDFRLGTEAAAERLAAELAPRLAGLTTAGRRRRVVVVAHSMGGLVARHWLGPLGGAPDCAALITLGTPHRGAPKALDLLVNGVRIGPARFDAVTGVLRGWPSVYELLPRYPAVGAPEGGARYPYQLTDGVPADFPARAKAAFGVHAEIERAWTELAGRPELPDLVPVFGRGHATPQRAVPTPAGLLVTKDAAEWLPNGHWHGDGTVPAISAVPPDLGEQPSRWRATPDRHLELPSSATVPDLLLNYAADSLQAVRGDTPDRPWLGLDLDEAVLAGTPTPVTVTLHGAAADERTALRIRARAEDGSGGTDWIDCARTGDTAWRASVPPLPPGAHRVVAEAVGVPGADRLRCADVLGAVRAEAP